MGLLKWKNDSAEALKKISEASAMPWHKKPEFWVGIIANIIALGSLIVAIIALKK